MSADSNDPDYLPPERMKNILLDHYHCTFFLPLLGFQAREDDGINQDFEKTYPPDQEQSDADAQAFHYFTPTLRDILFNSGDQSQQDLQPVREWVLPKEIFSGWLLALLPPNGKSAKPLNHQKASFQSVRLYRYFNGIYLLAFTVAPTVLLSYQEQGEADIPLFSSGKQFFDDYLEDGNIPEAYTGYGELQLEAWLRFTRLARQLYPSFTEQGDENKIAPLQLSGIDQQLVSQVSGEQGDQLTAFDKTMSLALSKPAEQLSSIVVALIQSFFTVPIVERLKNELSLFDDRMFVSVAYGLAGKPHTERTLNYVSALLATTDRVADGWDTFGHRPYSPEMYEDYLPGTAFNWWRALGGTFLFNDMVNAYLYNGWFFRNVIAPKHIPYIYDRMMVQALFYQASLRHYDQEITTTTQALLKDNADAAAIKGIREQRKAFIRFTN